MLFPFILKAIKKDPILFLVLFLFFWIVCSCAAAAISYAVIISITNPPQYLWSQSYAASIIMEVVVSFVIAFLNIGNKKNRLKRKDNMDKKEEVQKENKHIPKNKLLYFLQSFFFTLGAWLLFDFSYLTYLAPDHEVISSVMIQSAACGGIIALIFSLIFFEKKFKAKKSEQNEKILKLNH
jgi:hypothetical protein